ncbi:MAG: hypothetical protein CME32_09370 [Gimesia sp.]|nr:hypothetical protein [Gimesia sp.]
MNAKFATWGHLVFINQLRQFEHYQFAPGNSERAPRPLVLTETGIKPGRDLKSRAIDYNIWRQDSMITYIVQIRDRSGCSQGRIRKDT